MEAKEVIRFSELDPNFRFEIAREPGGEGIFKCYACGTCTASCPVRYVNDKFNPRKIIHMVLLGMREEVLMSDFVWLCATCYSCQERCPQGVKITDIMRAIQNIAAREGKLIELYRKEVELLSKLGRLYEIDDFDARKREKAGLPQLKSVNEELKIIFDETGLSKIAKISSIEGE
ncbi:MAG: 4Fe-4S dicluster domain-containing protein [bacterium]